MNAYRQNPVGSRAGFSVALLPTVLFILAQAPAELSSAEAAPVVHVASDASGSRLRVDGRDFMVFGMNWDYIPIGENHLYNLWAEPDDFIEATLEREMSLLRSMGVNAIRQYVGIPPRWVRYIYERYGIFTVLNHPVARYGYTLDGVWIESVDYSDPRLREAVTAEVVALVREFKDTPGVLMWLLGNENNYGLTWTSFEIEALPEGERDAARARHLYSLFGEITRAIKEVDTDRPVAIANGDIQYIDLIAEECASLDIFGANVYRGISVRGVNGVLREGLDRDGPLFDVVEAKLGIPVLFTEFGSDAFNARTMREDQVMQAHYLIGQWREIYEHSAGKGGVGNAIGGLVFQWSDGWWKYRQDERLDIHDTNASWPNGAYYDWSPGENNMNEEWWGICAKGPPDHRGFYQLYPRAAYFALQRAFRLDPYAPGTDLEAIRRHFAAIDPVSAELEARASGASRESDLLSRVRVSGLRLEFETFSTGGSRISTPEREVPGANEVPAFLGFDQLQSFYAEFEAKPAENLTGMLSVNVLGDVPLNPIDEIFYESRGRPVTVQTDDGDLVVNDIERVKVYQAGVSWDDRWFLLDGFYRTGHFHWGYEGDFFGLYREANYGENIDIYNGAAPVGFEVAGKRELQGLRLALGPQLWWGANPAVIVKADRQLGPIAATVIYRADLDEQPETTSSVAVPVPPIDSATLRLAGRRGPIELEVGGIWSGNTKIGQTFQVAEETDGGYRILEDDVRSSDTFGAKAKLTVQRGRWNWYAQAAYMGLVADGGPTSTITFTGWELKDSGSGNQSNIITGLAVNMGTFQIAPNFLYQKPLVGPIPAEAPSPARPRNILDDPFAVRANRETVGAELVLSYDPTPATWMWEWDNDVREDARLAASFGLVYRDLRTTQDAGIAVLEDGTRVPFPGATPPRELWEAKVRLVSRLSPNVRMVAHVFGGTGEPNGDDPRLIKRFGGDARIAWRSTAFETHAKFGDWGPYDYHRDFNLTFPVQLMGDVSYALGTPRWFGDPQTRLGLRSTWRSLDRNSPRYCPVEVPDASGGLQCDPNAPGPNGEEWEIRTYLHLSL